MKIYHAENVAITVVSEGNADVVIPAKEFAVIEAVLPFNTPEFYVEEEGEWYAKVENCTSGADVEIYLEYPGKLTRQQIVSLFGEEEVERLERESCEPTGRVGFLGAEHGDNFMEWKASIAVDHDTWSTIDAIYYTSNEQDEIMAASDGDGSAIEWKIDHYRVN